MPRRIGAYGELWRELISDDNLIKAIDTVNRTHHWLPGHNPNVITARVELDKADRVRQLRQIITAGFRPGAPRVAERYDPSAQKSRTISMPPQWPDQYVHHALIQVLQPVMMRGMDRFSCGSIRGRGIHYAQRAIARWMRTDPRGTRYCLTCDIRHFYQSLQPEVVMDRMRRLIRDARVLDLCERVTREGISIGYYTSQWFANTVLQPLDVLIRQSGAAAHYLRYMDNLTVFGPNKRKLHRLRRTIADWLTAHSLTLKSDWQVCRVIPPAQRSPAAPASPHRGGALPLCGRAEGLSLITPTSAHMGITNPKASPHRGGAEQSEAVGLSPCNPLRNLPGRLPTAVGFRFGRDFILPRKHTLLRIKRALARYRRRPDLSPREAMGLLSRLSILRHCNNHNLYRMLYRGERIERQLKAIVRARTRKETLTWTTFLERWATAKSSPSRALPTAS